MVLHSNSMGGVGKKYISLPLLCKTTNNISPQLQLQEDQINLYSIPDDAVPTQKAN